MARTLALLLTLTLAGSAAAQLVGEYDPAIAEGNTRWLQARVNEGYVRLPSGRLYIKGTVYTNNKVGSLRIETDGARSYPVQGHPGLTGNLSSIYQLGSGPILICCGNGVECSDPLELVGEGPRVPNGGAIEIEGQTNDSARGGAATGGHHFANISFENWDVGFKALGGYYENGKLIPSEGHADTTTVERCTFTKVGTVFRSENQQALDWMFRDIAIGVGDDKECVLADLVRGGWPIFDHVSLNHPRVTLFRLGDYSPNQCKLVCRDFRYDCPTAPDAKLRLVKYTGEAKGRDWDIEITGAAPIPKAVFDRDAFDVPKDLPRKRWKTADITTLK